MRIVFMGTPDFARTILERLVADGHDVCGVFTQPDKPRNRNKVTPSPVKEYALSQNIPVFQPVTMRDGTALEDFKTLAPELAVVAAYGRILPEEMLAVPVHGCINAHASILPKYRGAAPINRAILDGEKETGVTVMHMAKECDAGDMILVKKQAIRPTRRRRTCSKSSLCSAQTRSLRPSLRFKTARPSACRRMSRRRRMRPCSRASFLPLTGREAARRSSTRSARSSRALRRGEHSRREHENFPCRAARRNEGRAWHAVRAQKGHRSRLRRRQKHSHHGAAADGGKRMAANAFLNGKRIAAGTVLYA